MIAVFNSLPVKEGSADGVVELFASGRGSVHGFPGFISMEVPKDEVLVVPRWRDRESFDAWVHSEGSSSLPAPASVPTAIAKEGMSMFAVINRLPVKEGMADEIVRRFSHGQGFVQDFPGFVSLEVLRSNDGDEVMVITRWRDKEAFDTWVRSDAFNAVHGRGSGGMLRGHPQMSTYEVTVTRE